MHLCLVYLFKNAIYVVVDTDEDHVTMMQNVMQKCLENDLLCNEFYLQLVKQTTDHPGMCERGQGSQAGQVGYCCCRISSDDQLDICLQRCSVAPSV